MTTPSRRVSGSGFGIVDETHRCSARTAAGGQGRESRIVAAKRYGLVSRLSPNADHVILLTATGTNKFAHFLGLIHSDLFPEPLPDIQ